MKQVDLAEAAGVKPHTMLRYEKGQMKPGPEKVDRMADALGVPSRWLVRGGAVPPGLSFDEEAAPRRIAQDVRLVNEQQLQLLDEIDAAPDVRSTWTLHMHGRGAHQRITRVYMSRFVEVSAQELASGASLEQAEEHAGTYALNAALEAHAAALREPTEKRRR